MHFFHHIHIENLLYCVTLVSLPEYGKCSKKVGISQSGVCGKLSLFCFLTPKRPFLTIILRLTSSEMNDSATSKVVKSIDVEPPFRMPSPMGDNGINEAGDHDTIDNVSNEIATLG